MFTIYVNGHVIHGESSYEWAFLKKYPWCESTLIHMIKQFDPFQ